MQTWESTIYVDFTVGDFVAFGGFYIKKYFSSRPTSFLCWSLQWPTLMEVTKEEGYSWRFMRPDSREGGRGGN